MRTGGFLGIEFKFIDIAYSAAITEDDQTLGMTASYALNQCQQGTGESNRDGNKIVVTGIGMTGHVQYTPDVAGGAGAPFIVKLALVQDKQTNGAVLDPDNVYRASGTASQSPYTYRNLEYSKRFKVLWHKLIVVRPTCNIAATTPAICRVPFSFYKQMKMPTEFHGNAGTIADITDNSLQFMISAGDIEGAGTATLSYVSRVRFVG